MLASEGENVAGQLSAAGLILGQDQKRLGHGQAERVRAGHNGHFHYRRVLDQSAFQLKGADSVVGGFEHIVGATNKGDVALCVDLRGVARAVVAVAHHLSGLFRAVLVAQHQAERAYVQRQGHFTFKARYAVGVKHGHLIARQWTPHGARFEWLTRRVTDQGGGF
ncbi:hypothetical protein D3C78_636350 [compost metagenome]